MRYRQRMRQLEKVTKKQRIAIRIIPGGQSVVVEGTGTADGFYDVALIPNRRQVDLWFELEQSERLVRYGFIGELQGRAVDPDELQMAPYHCFIGGSCPPFLDLVRLTAAEVRELKRAEMPPRYNRGGAQGRPLDAAELAKVNDHNWFTAKMHEYAAIQESA